MKREDIIQQLIEAAREWRKSKFWAAQNASLMLSSSITNEEAGQIMIHYFDKESALIDILDKLNEIDGIENAKSFKEELESLEEE